MKQIIISLIIVHFYLSLHAQECRRGTIEKFISFNDKLKDHCYQDRLAAAQTAVIAAAKKVQERCGELNDAQIEFKDKKKNPAGYFDRNKQPKCDVGNYRSNLKILNQCGHLVKNIEIKEHYCDQAPAELKQALIDWRTVIVEDNQYKKLVNKIKGVPTAISDYIVDDIIGGAHGIAMNTKDSVYQSCRQSYSKYQKLRSEEKASDEELKAILAEADFACDQLQSK